MAKDAITLAWKNMRRRKFDIAIKLLESREDIYHNCFEYYLTLGIACLYVGDPGAANTYFQYARRLKVTDTNLLLGQAALYLRKGDTVNALNYYLDIKQNDPSNKIADSAMEFIRIYGNSDTISKWVDTGRIEQFYPPIGKNPDKIIGIIIPVIACLIGCVVAFTFLPKDKKYKGPRADLTKLELSDDEKQDSKEKDLSTQSYNFVFDNKEITKKYNNALNYFQNHRDNAAQIEINTILNSNANLSIKKKANVLMSYLEIPDFDTITDVPSYSEVIKAPFVYVDCWVNWGGKISNAITYDNGSYSCDLLVGDESLEHYEGTVNVKFDTIPLIDGSQSVKILGKISLENGIISLKGRAVYQSIHK